MKNKQIFGLGIGFLFTALVFSMIGANLLSTTPIVEERIADSGGGIRGHVWAYKNGELFAEEDNIVVNLGLNMTLDALTNSDTSATNFTAGTDAVKYIAVTNAYAESPGDVALAGELSGNGFDRAAGIVTYNSTGSFNVTHTFSITGGTTTVNGTGLYYEPTGNTLFAETSLTPATLISGDQLSVVWQILVSSG